jgi:hypothetical protein
MEMFGIHLFVGLEDTMELKLPEDLFLARFHYLLRCAFDI